MGLVYERHVYHECSLLICTIVHVRKCHQILCMIVMHLCGIGCDFLLHLSAAYPAVYGQFPQAIPQPMSAVPPTQREGKDMLLPYSFILLDAHRSRSPTPVSLFFSLIFQSVSLCPTICIQHVIRPESHVNVVYATPICWKNPERLGVTIKC